MGSQTYWRRYRFTSVGALDSTEISGGGISFVGRKYGYDTGNGALSMIRINGAATNLSVDNNLQVSSIAFPGADVESRSYNTLHTLMQITSSSGSYDPIIHRAVGFDAAGRISEQMFGDTVSSQRYGFDVLGRVASSTFGHYQTNVGWCLDPDYGSEGPCHQNTVWVADSGDTFTYDAAGNRSDRGGVYNPGNRIAQFDGCTYTTDSDGNVTSRTGGSCVKGTATSITWYAEGLLATITTGGSTIALSYDAAGRLVRKDLNGTPESRFLWDGSNLLAELDGSGTVKRAEYSYYPGMDRLHGLIIGSIIYYAHSDAMGSVIALTDVSQSPKRTYSFDVWGTLVGGADNLPFNDFDRARWKGALSLIPELNLYYMRNRWYEGGTGRFLSEDPAGAAGANLYVYAGDDPINGSDPSGLFVRECEALERVACEWPVGGSELERALSGGDARPAPSSDVVTESSEPSSSDLACIGNAGCLVDPYYVPKAGDTARLESVGRHFLENGVFKRTVRFTEEGLDHYVKKIGQLTADYEPWGPTFFVLNRQFVDAFNGQVIDAVYTGMMEASYRWYDVRVVAYPYGVAIVTVLGRRDSRYVP